MKTIERIQTSAKSRCTSSIFIVLVDEHFVADRASHLETAAPER